MAIPHDAAEGDLEDAEAELKLTNLHTSDYFSIPNGLFHTKKPDPAVVSLEIRWSGVTKRGSFSNPGQRFQMDYAQTGAHISWSGTNTKTGAKFHTTGGAQKVGFAQIAAERNGVFFEADEGDD